MNIDIDAEREFHNRRFAEGDSREAQLKYYWAIQSGADRYWSTVRRLSANADVLEYGCSTGERTNELSMLARSVHGIDISDVAIARATDQFGSSVAKFQVMDAANMSFADGSFDLVFGSGIIHHLDTRRSMQEISRVLRPSGSAVFWEPLGANPLINLYRRFTPDARTEDEHPLLTKDFTIMREYFRTVEVSHHGLTSLAAVLLRKSSVGVPIRAALSWLDQTLFLVPGAKDLAWYSLLRLTK
ncbi:MAG TPA: class I SAM-dependent methyltransferase [Xanthobacteraceae bacterium]|nr:class I SAM-dependent methyltransferase [Xanthobacteraceae bacterium]